MDKFWPVFWHWLPFAMAALAALCLAASLRAGRRQLLIDNLPTSKTTGAFIGLVELKGTAESDAPIRSHLGDVECVYYRYTVRERTRTYETESYTDSNGNNATRKVEKTQWETVAQAAVDTVPFFLKDDQGVIRIQPKGAQVEPQSVVNRTCGPSDPLYDLAGVRELMHSDRVREFKEEAIRLHTRIFVVGKARQRRDAVAAEIAEDGGAPLFLISTKSEQQVSRGMRLQFWLFGAAGVLLSGLYVHLRDIDLHPGLDPNYGAIARGGLTFAVAWFVGWVVMLFNSLIDLRQRVSQAWANIDVELKRRADLLPNLMAVVTALLEHERIVQPLLTAMRAQGGVSAPGKPGPDPVALANPVRLVAEAYPTLKAQPAFLKLQKQLVETEDRIALARGYFNEIATFYNTRLAQIPDGMIGALGGLRPRALMDVAGFERTAVQIRARPAFAGPCPQCNANVYALAPLHFCPYCGDNAVEPQSAASAPHCGGCGRYMKPHSATDHRLGGTVLFCGGCGFKLPLAPAAPPVLAPS